MKIRTDFVTNSSSSSFVIAYRKKYHGGSQPLDRIKDMAGDVLDGCDHYETESAEYFDSVAQIRAYLEYRYYGGVTIDDFLTDYRGRNHTEADIEKYLEDGYRIAIKKVSYHDAVTNELIDILNDISDDFVVLSGDGDY